MTLEFTPDPEVIKLWTDNKSFHGKINGPVPLTFRRGTEKIQSPTALVQCCYSKKLLAESS